MISLEAIDGGPRWTHLYCSSHAIYRFAVAHGGDTGDVYRCPAYDWFRHLSRESAAGVDIGLSSPANKLSRNHGQCVGAAVCTDGGESAA